MPSGKAMVKKLEKQFYNLSSAWPGLTRPGSGQHTRRWDGCSEQCRDSAPPRAARPAALSPPAPGSRGREHYLQVSGDHTGAARGV